MLKRKTLLILAFLPFSSVITQDTINHISLAKRLKSMDLLIGIHAQVNDVDQKNYTYYEVGLAKARYYYHRHGITASAVYISEEMHFDKDKNIFGTKAGAWMHWLFDLGVSAIYYTDFKKGNFKMRPEIGFGMGRVRAVIGYNIPTINNKDFKELQKNRLQFTAQVTFGLKKKIINSPS